MQPCVRIGAGSDSNAGKVAVSWRKVRTAIKTRQIVAERCGKVGRAEQEPDGISTEAQNHVGPAFQKVCCCAAEDSFTRPLLVSVGVQEDYCETPICPPATPLLRYKLDVLCSSHVQ